MLSNTKTVALLVLPTNILKIYQLLDLLWWQRRPWLLDPDSVTCLIKIISKSYLITPNLPEAEDF